MTTLEFILVCFSVIETIVSAILWKKHMEAKARYQALEAEYRASADALRIWGNAV